MDSKIRSLPSFASLRAFEAVARIGQITRAARELNLTQSAVSHRLKDLETHLGIPLISRKGGSFELTEAGRTIAVNLSAIFTQLDLVLKNAAPSLPQHKLTVSLHPGLGSLWLAQRLGDFFKAHPNVMIELRSGQALANFGGTDGVDAAVRYGPGGWPGLHVTKIMEERLILACNRAYNGGVLPTMREQLTGLHVIRDNHDSLIDWFQAAGIGMPPRMQEIVVDDPMLVAGSLLSDGCIALVRQTLISDRLASGEVVPLLNTSVPSRYGYYFVCPVSQAFENKIVIFRNWLMNQAMQ